MKPSDDDHDADPTEERAADWLARRAGGFTRAEAAEFDRWWRADARRAAAVARLESAEGRLLGLARFADDEEFRALRPGAEAVQRGARWAAWVPWAVAASIAVLFFFSRAPSVERDTATVFTTTENGYQRLMLAGTMVQLNERTALRADVSSAAAELMRGEASVTVVPGARAFELGIGSRRVHCAAGTVIAHVTEENVTVLVTAGAAEIRSGEKEPVRVSAGTRLSIGRSGAAAGPAEQVTPAAMQELLAWQAPRIPLADTRLADAVEQFNLYNWEQLELADRALAERRVSGVFRADSTEEFATYLRREHRITVERVNRTSSSDRNSPGGVALLLRPAP